MGDCAVTGQAALCLVFAAFLLCIPTPAMPNNAGQTGCNLPTTFPYLVCHSPREAVEVTGWEVGGTVPAHYLLILPSYSSLTPMPAPGSQTWVMRTKEHCARHGGLPDPFTIPQAWRRMGRTAGTVWLFPILDWLVVTFLLPHAFNTRL